MLNAKEERPSGEKMRKPVKGAPTKKNFKQAKRKTMKRKFAKVPKTKGGTKKYVRGATLRNERQRLSALPSCIDKANLQRL